MCEFVTQVKRESGCGIHATFGALFFYLVVEGCAASRASVAADGGRVVHDPLVDEQAAAQLEQFAARGADEAVVAVRREQMGLVFL